MAARRSPFAPTTNPVQTDNPVNQAAPTSFTQNLAAAKVAARAPAAPTPPPDTPQPNAPAPQGPTVTPGTPDPYGTTDPNQRPGPAQVDPWGDLIKQNFQTAWHRDPTQDEVGYWTGKLTNASSQPDFDQEYWSNRILGSGSGGADVVPYGPFAGQDVGTGQKTSGGSSDLSGLIAQLTGMVGAGGGGGGVPGGGVPSAPSAGPRVDINSIIQSLLDPSTNAARVNSRVGQSRDALERQRHAETDTLSSQLADRGLMGQGPEASSLERLDERLGSQFGDTVAGIQSDESARSDDQLIKVLALATGLTTDQAANEIAKYNAETNRALGAESNATNRAGVMGNLALGEGRLNLDTMLGSGNLALDNLHEIDTNNINVADFGLRRDLGLAGVQNTNIEQILELIRIMSGTAGQSAGGAVQR